MTPERPISPTLSAMRRGDRPHGQGGSGDASEAAIMAATERLLATTPLHELSVADIVREAKISRGTFYFWFSSKFAVVIALLAEAMDEMSAGAAPFIQETTETSYEQALQTGIAAAAEVWERHRFPLRAAMQHWHTYPDLRTVLFELVDWLSEMLAAAIERGRAERLIPSGPPAKQLAATLIWSAQYALYIAGLHEDASRAHAETTETLQWIWTRALTTTSA